MKPLSSLISKMCTYFSRPQGAITLFLISCALLFLYMYKHSHPSSFQGQPLANSYLTLLNSVTTGGIAKYRENKSALRQHISLILANPSSDNEESEASNIALYLFPDLLPESNFEKTQAFELWAKLQEEIEKNPRTPKARMFFEEMKSNIWNYENPRMTNAGLSEDAQETIKLFHELSSP